MQSEIYTQGAAKVANLAKNRETQPPTLDDLADRLSGRRRPAITEKAVSCHWCFLHNGTEIDIPSGATLAEARKLLGLNSDDTLKALPVTEQSKPLSEEEVGPLLDRAITGLNLSRSQLCAELSDDDMAGIQAGDISFETLQGYARVWASREPIPDDDRRYCRQCENLSGNRCRAAARGEIDGARNQHPFDKVPRRCVAYLPGADDPDKRPGRERWQGLAKYETDEVTA